MADNSVPAVSTADASGNRSEAVGPWPGLIYNVASANADALRDSQVHRSNVNAICQGMLGDARSTADMLAKKFGVLFTEPNAESSSAEETMKASGLPELTSANASAAMSSGLATSMVTIQTAQASLAASMADLKAALIPALEAIASSLAVVQANVSAGAPKSGAVKE